VTARAISAASLRAAPSVDALIVTYAPAGSSFSVVGCAGGCTWLLIATQSGTLWSARHFWAVSGDLSTIYR
jgi:uncharacterized protein YraI